MNKLYAVFFSLLIVLLFTGSAFAQIKLPQKETKSNPKPVQEKAPKKEEEKKSKGLVQTLKVTSNAPCKFYVDGEFKGIVNSDQILKTDLSKGEYQFKAISTDNDADVWQAFYTVDQVSVEKFYEIDLQTMINGRVAFEKAAVDAKRQLEQREEERLKKEAQDARDKQEREAQYNTTIAKANDYYLDKDYAQAEMNYTKALELKPSSMEAKNGMENIYYHKATKNDTEEWYSYYIKNYPSGTYINDVKKKYEVRKEENAYQRAKSSNQMDDYESYVNKYPSGKYANETKTLVENSYFSFGQNSYNSKSYDEAKKQLEYYINRYPSGRYISDARDLKAKTDRKIKAANRPDKFILSYAFDRNAYIGLTLGTYNQKKAGMYFALRMNSDLFTWNTYTSNDVPDYFARIGELRAGKMDGILGMTYGIVNPIWLYMGVGMGFYPKFVNYYYDGKTEWVRNSSDIGGSVTEYNRTKIPFLHEFGLAVSLGPINGSAGVCLRNYKEAFMMFTVGFSINR